jgi:Pyruvate/2-oxoacid:ferredoxin oxidoreductase delta subunit
MAGVKLANLFRRQNLARPVWFVNLIKKAFPQRFWLAKLTNLPIVGEVVDWGLFNGDDIYYLPTDRSLVVNESISNPGDYVLPSQIVDHFIDTANHLWVMDFCLCREGNQCEDYSQQLGCLFLGEAVHQINPELGRLVSREEAHQHIERCREAGLVHMIGRNKLDAIWLGAGPGEKLMTICNCCPCCCLWKFLPDITPQISAKVNRLPGVSVIVNDSCLGCGDCTQGICFVDAIQLVDDHAQIGFNCRGCGQCVDVCPNEAIELSIQEKDFVDHTIHHITQLVDVN